MQSTSDLYKAILADRSHIKQARVVIAGVEYAGKGDIRSLSTSAALFSKTGPGIGGCVCKEIDITVMKKAEIPRMADVRVFVRLALVDERGTVLSASEWLPKGVYYIDTRKPDSTGEVLDIHGYDAMLKAEQTYMSEGDVGEWPRSMAVVASDIARRMGVEIDSRTVIHPTYKMGYPNDYTMREILGYIGAAHGGNWIMTDEGKLRLVGLTDIPAETRFLVTENGQPITFGGVRVLV